MLPGWMMPIDELINNVLSAPPREAARVLVALPPDRFEPVLQAMRLEDLIRVALAAKPNVQSDLMARLSIAKIQDMVQAMAPSYAATLLSSLPPKRLVAVMEGVSPQQTSELLRERIRSVITHRFPAEEWEQAFAAARSGEVGKVIMDWS